MTVLNKIDSLSIHCVDDRLYGCLELLKKTIREVNIK